MKFLHAFVLRGVLGSVDVDSSCFSPRAPELYKVFGELSKLDHMDDAIVGGMKEPRLCKFGPGDTLGVAIVGDIVVGERIGGGCNGDVYATSNPNIVVKVSSVSSLISEQAVLVVANGLDGFAPLMHPITRMDKPECIHHILVMDRVGELDWASSSITSLRIIYTRFANLLRAVEKLHAIGFAHLHARSFIPRE